MSPDISVIGLILTIICLLGFYGAYLYGRKTKKFRWREYILIVIWPLICIAVLVGYIGYEILYLFIASVFVGTIFEFLLGLVYEKTLNQKLWKYNRLSIYGYTSILSVPLWGVAGVVFWSLGKILGLQ